jgi:DNA invertase Pin-like site-specific DNA recombinase
MEAVHHLRASTVDQVEDGVSLESKEARAWCDLNGYAFKGIFINAGISGSKRANRPELQDALSHCKKGVALVV